MTAVSPRPLSTRTGRPPALAVTSGKGGVGKTNVVANLAVALARTGRRVTVVDADFGLANLDVLLGLTPTHTIEHVFAGSQSLTDIAVTGPAGIRVIPAASGIPDFTRLDEQRRRTLSDGIDALRRDCDLLLIDTAAGIAENVSSLLMAADRVLVVTRPDPTALVDAYAVLKVLASADADKPAGLLVNDVRDEAEAGRVHRQLELASRRFLGRDLQLDGFVVHDSRLADAARRQQSVVDSDPLAASSRCFERLASRLARVEPHADGDFWERLGLDGATPSLH